MTPQSSFMVVAPIRAGRDGELRGLAGMNHVPGGTPIRRTLSFVGRFSRSTLPGSWCSTTAPRQTSPSTACRPRRIRSRWRFSGTATATTARTFSLRGAGPGGLRRLFLCCEGFAESTDVAGWMDEHEHPPRRST